MNNLTLKFNIILPVFYIILCSCNAQNQSSYRFMFYNAENLFDTIDDPTKRDGDFTPQGSKEWDNMKYRQKLIKTAKVILAVGENQLPVIVGLCEIENKKVLEDLIEETPLKKTGYNIVHEESPDERGIDVALLYDKKKFIYISHKVFPVTGNRLITRDILYVKGIISKRDTIHIFVNHWPSRRGGVKASESKRIKAATVLKNITDSLYREDKSTNIIIMGDFNDEPRSKSIKFIACTSPDECTSNKLYNPMLYLKKQGRGTTSYKNRWYLFDQFIVSPTLIDENNPIRFIQSTSNIYSAEWLLNINKTAPLRTYQGPVYKGGFSDHLPVYIDVFVN